MRRLHERFKQTIWIANETYHGSGEYQSPLTLKAIVSPKSSFIRTSNLAITERTDEHVVIETFKVVEKGIAKNSRVWIKCDPDPLQDGADYTHKVEGIQLSVDNKFTVLTLRGADWFNQL